MDLIVNADDLGMSLSINESIFELMDQGLVTSASVLANSPHLEDACPNIKRFPQCSFGAHLNLTEFQPLSGPEGLQLILNNAGDFNGECIRRVTINSQLKMSIFREFCSQIEHLRSRNIPLTHIDSHQYVTTIPRMIPILRQVQKKFRIPRIRLSRNIYGLDEQVSIAMRGKKAIYNFLLRHYVGATTTAGFAGFDLFHQVATAKRLKHSSFEVVVHPGNRYYPDSETELLLGTWRTHLPFAIRLINDYDLI